MKRPPLPPSLSAQGAVPGGTSHRAMAVRYLAAHEAIRKLRDNMREEHILVLDFVSTIFKHVSAQAAQGGRRHAPCGFCPGSSVLF